mgnify:CR=1 FL=1
MTGSDKVFLVIAGVDIHRGWLLEIPVEDLDTSVMDAFSAVYVWRHAYTVEMKKSMAEYNIYHVITSHSGTLLLPCQIRAAFAGKEANTHKYNT